jgi:hypothetical protein
MTRGEAAALVEEALRGIAELPNQRSGDVYVRTLLAEALDTIRSTIKLGEEALGVDGTDESGAGAHNGSKNERDRASSTG